MTSDLVMGVQYSSMYIHKVISFVLSASLYLFFLHFCMFLYLCRKSLLYSLYLCILVYNTVLTSC